MWGGGGGKEGESKHSQLIEWKKKSFKKIITNQKEFF